MFLMVALFVQSATMAQVYDAGAVLMNGTVLAEKYEAQLIIDNSVFYLDAEGINESRKIVNNQKNVLYVTDGTAIDRITIVKKSGKIAGFSFTYVLTYQHDTRWSNGTTVYYCTLRD